MVKIICEGNFIYFVVAIENIKKHIFNKFDKYGFFFKNCYDKLNKLSFFHYLDQDQIYSMLISCFYYLLLICFYFLNQAFQNAEFCLTLTLKPSTSTSHGLYH